MHCSVLLCNHVCYHGRTRWLRDQVVRTLRLSRLSIRFMFDDTSSIRKDARWFYASLCIEPQWVALLGTTTLCMLLRRDARNNIMTIRYFICRIVIRKLSTCTASKELHMQCRHVHWAIEVHKWSTVWTLPAWYWSASSMYIILHT